MDATAAWVFLGAFLAFGVLMRVLTERSVRAVCRNPHTEHEPYQWPLDDPPRWPQRHPRYTRRASEDRAPAEQ